MSSISKEAFMVPLGKMLLSGATKAAPQVAKAISKAAPVTSAARAAQATVRAAPLRSGAGVATSAPAAAASAAGAVPPRIGAGASFLNQGRSFVNQARAWPGWYKTIFGGGRFPATQRAVDYGRSNFMRAAPWLGAGYLGYNNLRQGAEINSLQGQIQELEPFVHYAMQGQQPGWFPEAFSGSSYGSHGPSTALERYNAGTAALQDFNSAKTSSFKPPTTNISNGAYSAASNGVGVVPPQAVASVRNPMAPVKSNGGPVGLQQVGEQTQLQRLLDSPLEKVKQYSGIPEYESLESAAMPESEPVVADAPEPVEIPPISPYTLQAMQGVDLQKSPFKPSDSWLAAYRTGVAPPRPQLGDGLSKTGPTRLIQKSDLPPLQDTYQQVQQQRQEAFEKSPYYDTVRQIAKQQVGLESDMSKNQVRQVGQDLLAKYEEYASADPTGNRIPFDEWLERYAANPNEQMLRPDFRVRSMQRKRLRRRKRNAKRSSFEVGSFAKTAIMNTEGQGGSDNLIDQTMWNWTPAGSIGNYFGVSPGRAAQWLGDKTGLSRGKNLPSLYNSGQVLDYTLGSADDPANRVSQDVFDGAMAPGRAAADAATYSLNPYAMVAGVAANKVMDTARPFYSRAGSWIDSAYEAAGYGKNHWSGVWKDNIQGVSDWANKPVDASGGKGLGYYARLFASPFVSGTVNSTFTNTTPQSPQSAAPPNSPAAKPAAPNWMSQQEIDTFVNK